MRLNRLGLTCALLHWQLLVAQTTRVQDLSLNVDTTFRADLKLHLLRSEFPVTVAAGEHWEGTFTLQYAGTIPLSQSVLTTLIYENRDTYLSLAQPISKLDKDFLPPGKPVQFRFDALVPPELPNGSTKIKVVFTREGEILPLKLPMKYDNPPGYYHVGKINVLTNHRQKKKRIVFFGDSITQEGTMPDGYISQIEKMNASLSRYELIGAGIGGDRVTNLSERADADVLIYQPETVVIWVGVNDCGWFKWVPTIGGTSLTHYEQVLEELVQKMTRNNSRVVLCTPAVIGEKHTGENDLDTELDQYAEIVRRVAQRQGTKLVDLRKVFTRYLKTHNPENRPNGILTTDGIHLTPQGSRLVAEALSKQLR